MSQPELVLKLGAIPLPTPHFFFFAMVPILNHLSHCPSSAYELVKPYILTFWLGKYCIVLKQIAFGCK